MSSDDATPTGFVSRPGLAPDVVASAVGYRMSTPEPEIHRGLPSPTLTFIVSLARPIVTGESVDHARSTDAYRNQVILSGLHTRPAYIDQQGIESGMQLAVRPLAARALLGLPAAELRNLTTEGADVWGAPITQLQERMIEAADWSSRFTIMAEFLQRSMATDRCAAPRPEVAEAWRWIAHTGGTGSMTGLARHVLLSQRQLTTLFRAEFGLSPKAVSRLVRFHRARQLVVARAGGADADLATIAHRCGYYDHAHLVRDFQAYVGTSPTGWLAEEHQNFQAGSGDAGTDWTP